MSGQLSLRANYGSYDQGQADVGSFVGNSEQTRAQMRDLARTQIDNMGLGDGSAQHAQIMAQVDKLIDEHINNGHLHGTGIGNAGQTLQGAGRAVISRVSNSAL